MKPSHVREWGENNRVINLSGHFFLEKSKGNSRHKAEAQVINLKANLP